MRPMTFQEIGDALGVSRQRAYMIYLSAMGKLTRYMNTHPEEAQEFLEVLQELSSVDESLGDEDWYENFKIGFPKVWYWNYIPDHKTFQWRERTLKILDKIT